MTIKYKDDIIKMISEDKDFLVGYVNKNNEFIICSSYYEEVNARLCVDYNNIMGNTNRFKYIKKGVDF